MISAGCSPDAEPHHVGRDVRQLAPFFALLQMSRNRRGWWPRLYASQVRGAPDARQLVNILRAPRRLPARRTTAGDRKRLTGLPYAGHVGVDQPQVAAGQFVQRVIGQARYCTLSTRG
jgi:hypothetical protein